MRRLQLITVIWIFLLGFSIALLAQKDKDDKKEKKDKIKPFAEVITDKAVSDDGLFNVHQMDEKTYFEISNDLLDKEMLVVSRITGHVKGLNFGGSGMKSRPQQVVRWQRHGGKILLRSVSYNSVADHDDPVYRSVLNNNFEPVIMTFDIEAMGPTSNSVVFNATSLFTSDVEMIGAMSRNQRKNFEIKSLDSKRSFVARSKSFPQNVEIWHVLTYKGTKLPDNQLTGSLSIEMNQSFVLLPEKPMRPRFYDPRVGFFSLQQINYSLDEQKAATQRFITRWRLEPKDMDAFKRGELVEPVKPIVYYLDPATPAKWAPYIKQGVDDWNAAFEKAGFKNAIMGKYAPTPEEDPDWHPEDVRYSVIRYITTDIQNAQGPHVHDPRTGEILESDILWYHNVMNLLRNWFFIQTAAINPEAQGVKFKDEVMGELIRFVSAHEVGHTLGFPHNMGSSVAYPVDSLRSPTFSKKMGTAPSIMDYARFNYVAQPEDGDVGLYPQIGPYDEWNVIYGYKPLPEVASAEAERPILNSWIKERAGNPLYRYGQQRFNPVDPSAQTEDLGDDAVKASMYGIANMKRIVPNLVKWSKEDGKGYENLRELYQNIFAQLGRYMRHVGTNVGGVYEYRKTGDEDGVVFTPVPGARQAESVRFLNEQLFATPRWLIDADVLRRIESHGMLDRLLGLQNGSLNRLFEGPRLQRLAETAAIHQGAYTMTALYDDVRNGIWSELRSKSAIDPYRRNLQRAYVDKMIDILKSDANQYNRTDIKAVTRGTLKQLYKDVKKGAGKQKDQTSRYHLENVMATIGEALDMDD